MAKNCINLRIENSNFSYNYRQQLQSSWLQEDVSDWMSYHHNEQDEWLRYGAGIYLKDCKLFYHYPYNHYQWPMWPDDGTM
jgi:hypothetical protein